MVAPGRGLQGRRATTERTAVRLSVGYAFHSVSGSRRPACGSGRRRPSRSLRKCSGRTNSTFGRRRSLIACTQRSHRRSASPSRSQLASPKRRRIQRNVTAIPCQLAAAHIRIERYVNAVRIAAVRPDAQAPVRCGKRCPPASNVYPPNVGEPIRHSRRWTRPPQARVRRSSSAHTTLLRASPNRRRDPPARSRPIGTPFSPRPDAATQGGSLGAPGLYCRYPRVEARCRLPHSWTKPLRSLPLRSPSPCVQLTCRHPNRPDIPERPQEREHPSGPNPVLRHAYLSSNGQRKPDGDTHRVQ